ncbi:hypothetical protein B0H17DRAFT_1126421 [Mycena rosella]|uniref:CxC2-like cysteine cluster KDZ transposase-associated domain-containing protein n=1 Tax=Mycena rosella TaxID=1033263 RepID=A0AAD7M7K2_MYCRO|nr:hypothetical protein B0H17DRAFT_1126421 [Mycena rosella]
MSRPQKRQARKNELSSSLLPTNVPTFTVTYHTDSPAPKCQERYRPNTQNTTVARPAFFDNSTAIDDEPTLPCPVATADAPSAMPAYETTTPCNEKGAKKKRANVGHMDELKAQEAVFLQTLLSRHHDPLLLTRCACGKHDRKIGCSDCLDSELLCRQCWLDKHRTMPMHWALIWNATDKFFEKSDFCCVRKNTVIGLGHHGQWCRDAELGRTFTLVDSNGIHATALAFCRCPTADGQRGAPEFQQLLRAGIFPGSIEEPKTGYTLGVLEYYRQLRSQGKDSAYNFVHVLRHMANPFFMGSVPDIYINFIAVTQFHQHLDIIMKRRHAHAPNDALPGEADRPYPNRPIGYLGLQCAACPERGVNMPLIVNIPNYLRHLVSQHFTLDGNFKVNLFFKRDDGSDTALMNGKMYFPLQREFDAITKSYVIPDKDKEVPCRAHIRSIRHQGQIKYGNTAISGVVASACDHAVAGAFIEMLNARASQAHQLAARTHQPQLRLPLLAMTATVKRAITLFPAEAWLQELLASIEGQIPADHINGHGPDCQSVWQAVYFTCQAHFHRETAEMIWAFLNPLGSSTCQMTGAAWHEVMNFVVDAWNTWKVLGQAALLAAELVDTLRLFELHMAVVEDLSRQHATEVAACVYQHESTKVLTIESVLASLAAEERAKSTREAGAEAATSAVQWIHDGMEIQRQQALVVALLNSHRDHPLQETWETISKLRDSLNLDLKRFRQRQRTMYPRLTLSALDVDEPELTTIQLPSYCMKHGQRTAADATDHSAELRETETRLRCAEANSKIIAVQGASLALAAVKKARELDYRGQAGITCTQRNLQKAELMKDYEIEMYNKARAALIHLGYMKQDAVDPYPPLSRRDTWRKETHLHRVKGDSWLFDGTVWYLQSGATIAQAGMRVKRRRDDEDEPQLLAGTQTPKRSGYTRSPRAPKRLKDIAPDNVVVDCPSSSEAEDSNLEMSPSKPEMESLNAPMPIQLGRAIQAMRRTLNTSEADIGEDDTQHMQHHLYRGYKCLLQLKFSSSAGNGVNQPGNQPKS